MFNKYIESDVGFSLYDTNSPVVYENIKTTLSKYLLSHNFYHFGSSAITDIGGKGIIDIFISTDLEKIHDTVTTLENIGFHYPDFRTKPFPLDRPMRAASVEYSGKNYNIHAHITYEGNPDIDKAIRFVKNLNHNRKLREDYENLKKQIINSGVKEKDEYSKLKSPFIINTLMEIM